MAGGNNMPLDESDFTNIKVKDKINELKEIEFLQFLNSQPGLTGKNSHKGTKTQRKNVYYN
jgi:hypothetical protein